MSTEKINFLMPKKGNIATKIFKKAGKNQWELQKEYTAGKYFKGFSIPVNDLKGAYSILKENQEHPVFMIHGEFISGTDTNNMIRRKRKDHKDSLPPTICDRQIHLMCFDIDGFNIPDINWEDLKNLNWFIRIHLPNEFHTADYIYQYSASYGLTTHALNCHLFFWLEEPIHNMEIKSWIRAYNKIKDWGNIIDDSIFTCTQPIYTQKRICIGAEDPIDNFMGYVEKEGSLKWKPETTYIDTSSGLTEVALLPTTNKKEPYDLVAGVEKILTSTNYHEELNKLALSLINRRVPPNTVQQMLQGAMNAAKRNLNNSKRLEEWQMRFDDIGRSVSSAAEIVDNPTFEEIAQWINDTPEYTVRADFAKRVLSLTPIELKGIVSLLCDKLKVGPQPINASIKEAKKEQEKEVFEIVKQAKTQERLSKGIVEISLSNDNHGDVTKTVSKLLSFSEKKPQPFMIGKSLSIIDIGCPKTVRQVISKNSQGDDYPNMPITKDISKPLGVLRSRIEQECIFLNENGKAIVCPDSILAAIPKMYGVEWKPLTGIVEHPFLDDKWKLVQKDGYDRKTGLFSVLHRKLKLTPMDPIDAYNYLCEEVFEEFPFASDLDKTAAVAALMTAIQRPYICGDGGFPGFAIVSPTQSSGKTTLAQLISYAIYNRPVAATSWSDNDEELGKHLLAILREGHSCVLFDNIRKGVTIKSDELAKAMTSGTYSRRRLGENETEEVPANVLWIFTGNNIRFVDDFATRILPIRIIPNMERPENRKFKRDDIGAWTLDNRKKIISAVISIIAFGKNIPDDEFEDSSRFKAWEKFVRKPLLKLSGNDILEIFKRNNYDDDVTLSQGELLRLLHQEFQDKAFKTRDLLRACNGDGDSGAFNSNGNDLKISLIESFGEKSVNNSKTLGRHLLGMKDAIIGDFKLIRLKKSMGVNWMVKEA